MTAVAEKSRMSDGGIQIVGDGTSEGTKILLDGRPIRGVSELSWRFNSRERRVTIQLEVTDVKIDMTAMVDPEVQNLLERLADQI